MTSRAATIDDVAVAAGVSMGTVSNVLNHPERVLPATRQRVEEAITALNYVPNGAARSLAAGRSAILGFVVADLTNSFFVDMVRGAQSVSEPAGFKLLLADAGAEGEQQAGYLDVFEEARAAGILFAPRDATLDATRHLRSRQVPIVLLNAPFPEVGRCVVEPDNALGGYLAARHLIDLSRRRLLWVGPTTFGPTRERLNGAQRAVHEAGGQATLTVCETQDVTIDDGRRVAELVHDMPTDSRPDGVIAGADMLAVGFSQLTLGRGALRIPQDIALVGYDNNRAAWGSAIPLTTLDQAGASVGRAAAEMLLDELARDGERRYPHQHRTTRVQPTLIPRASTLG